MNTRYSIHGQIEIATTDDPRVIIKGYDADAGKKLSLSFDNTDEGKNAAKAFLTKISDSFEKTQVDGALQFIDTFDEPNTNEVI